MIVLALAEVAVIVFLLVLAVVALWRDFRRFKSRLSLVAIIAAAFGLLFQACALVDLLVGSLNGS